MTEKELNAALDIQKELYRKRAALDSLEAGGYKSSLGSVGRRRRASTAAQDAAELTEEIKELERNLEIEQEIIRRAIEKAPLDKDERKMLLLHYVECRKWNDVFLLTWYSKSRALYYRKKAVGKILHGEATK